jgi:SidE phosphodiesterase (PDE) domain
MPTYYSKKPSYQKKSDHKQPPMGSTAVFSWNSLSQHQNFWKQPPTKRVNSFMSVVQEISNSIIERPYHYDKHKIITKNGSIDFNDPSFKKTGNYNPPVKNTNIGVYKQNHGTGHALRQMVYTEKLLDWIAANGNAKGAQLAKSINSNPQLKEAVKLAAFCKRIGRTLDYESDNNRPNGVPTIYSKRSAQMFEKMAHEMGFNQELVKILKHAMYEPAPKNMSHGDIDGINGKELFAFSHAVFEASHKSDLTRIFKVKRSLIKKDLNQFVEAKDLDRLSRKLVELGCKANELTGNPVKKQEAPINNHPKDMDGNVLVRVVNDINGAYHQLSQLSLDNSIHNKHVSTKSHKVSNIESKNIQPLNVPEKIREKIMIDKESTIDMANNIISASQITGIKLIPRIENYKKHDKEHNLKQPLNCLQFEFKTLEDRNRFASLITKQSPKAIAFFGLGKSKQPIVQIKADAIQRIDLNQLQDIAVSSNVSNEKSKIINKAKHVVAATKIPGIKLIPRIENYIKHNKEHNLKQPLNCLQFEFKTLEDRNRFASLIKKQSPKAIAYFGLGKSKQPIVQIKADAIQQINLNQLQDIAVSTSSANEKSKIIGKAKDVIATTQIPGIKLIPRIENYKKHDKEHNLKQPLNLLQFEFKTREDRNLFASLIKKQSPKAIAFFGHGKSKQPIVQIKADAIQRIDLNQLAKFSKDEKAMTHKSNPMTFFSNNSTKNGEFKQKLKQLHESLTLIDNNPEQGNSNSYNL